MNLDVQVGTNIRNYRRANHLSLKELANSVHKSISTISKYEKGMISVDVTTLAEIAACLHVMPMQLLTCDTNPVGLTDPSNSSNASSAASSEGLATSDFFDTHYLYYYDRSVDCIIKGILKRMYKNPADAEPAATLFSNVKDIKNPGSCAQFYSGSCQKTGFTETYFMHNQANTSEYIMITCIPNLVDKKHQKALISALSNRTMLPIAFKAIVSENIINDEEALLEKVKFTKEEIQMFRKEHRIRIQN